MKLLMFVSFLAVCGIVQAECPSTLPLKGISAIENCDHSSATCVDASKTMYRYMEERKDDNPEELVIGLNGSPWHVYDPDYHILEINELAGLVKQQGDKIKRVILLSSWSGIAPDKYSKTLAQKLSLALNGMPVTGEDGFVWFSKGGAVHTTQQSFTIFKNGPYLVAEGDKVMASLAAGWPFELEAEFAKKHNAVGLMRAGVGFDIFMLCPERALNAYDASAALSDPIAAYNAAIMRLERGNPGDAESAISLLKQSSNLGDKKAQAKLKSLSNTLAR